MTAVSGTITWTKLSEVTLVGCGLLHSQLGKQLSIVTTMNRQWNPCNIFKIHHRPV